MHRQLQQLASQIVTTNANSNGQNTNFVMGIPATFDQQNKGHDVLNVNDIKLNVPKEWFELMKIGH